MAEAMPQKRPDYAWAIDLFFVACILFILWVMLR